MTPLRSATGAPPQGGAAGGPAKPDPRRLLDEASPPSPLRAFWAAFSENRGAVVGLAIVTLVVLLAIFADVVAPYGPTEQFRDAVRAAPAWAEGGSSRFLLGTDSLGRDMLSRLIHGARISLFIGLSVMGVSFVIGVALGLLACASLGNAVDVAITRLMDLHHGHPQPSCWPFCAGAGDGVECDQHHHRHRDRPEIPRYVTRLVRAVVPWSSARPALRGGGTLQRARGVAKLAAPMFKIVLPSTAWRR